MFTSKSHILLFVSGPVKPKFETSDLNYFVADPSEGRHYTLMYTQAEWTLELQQHFCELASKTIRLQYRNNLAILSRNLFLLFTLFSLFDIGNFESSHANFVLSVDGFIFELVK